MICFPATLSPCQELVKLSIHGRPPSAIGFLMFASTRVVYCRIVANTSSVHLGQGPLLRLPAGAGRGSDSSRIGAPATSPACGGPAAAARADAQRSALSRGAQKRRTAKEAAAKLSTTRVELSKAASRDYHMVGRHAFCVG